MVLKGDPSVRLDGARPPLKYVCKYTKIKIVEFYSNNLQFGDKTIQQWILPDGFFWNHASIMLKKKHT